MEVELIPEPSDVPFIQLKLTKDEFDLILALGFCHARIGRDVGVNPGWEALKDAARVAGVDPSVATTRATEKGWLA